MTSVIYKKNIQNFPLSQTFETFMNWCYVFTLEAQIITYLQIITCLLFYLLTFEAKLITYLLQLFQHHYNTNIII